MKLHPLSIPYRILQTAPTIIVLVFFGTFALGQLETPWVIPIGIFALIISIAGIILWQIAYYQRFEYEPTSETFDIRSGVISRRNREIPYRRIQNVDISRTLVQRILNIAELRIETAGGGQSEAHLRYVGYGEAKRLQDEIRSRTRRVEVANGSTADAQSGTGYLYRISDRDLGVLAIASFDLRVASLVFVMLSFIAPSVLIDLVTAAPIDPLVILVAVVFIVVVLSAIISGTTAIVNNWEFTLTRLGDELRYERGLLQRYDGSIPLDKVQTLIIGENVLMRYFGYASLTTETAGYAPGQGAAESARAVPISKREETVAIGKQIEPFEEATFHRPATQARIRYVWQYTILFVILAVTLFGVNAAFNIEFAWWAILFAIPLIPIAAHFKWKHRGYAVTENYVLMRTGYWRRRTHVVPFYRIQTVDQVQSILQARWHIATVVIDTAGSSGLVSGDPTAYDLPEDVAEQLHETCAAELQTSLRRRKQQKRLFRSVPAAVRQGVRGVW